MLTRKIITKFNTDTFCYAFMYFFCIPLFACLFSWVLPENSFYQSTIKIENSYTAHAREIAGRFCDAIMEDEENRAQDVSGYNFVRSDLRCTKLRIDHEDHLGFTLEVTLHKKQQKFEDLLVIPFLVTLDSFDIKTLDPEFLKFVPPSESAEKACAVAFIHPIKVDTLSLPLMSPDHPGDPATNSLKERLFFGYGSPTILLNNCFEDELAKFLKESNGFTSNASDNFMRMFYLSAMTITTIGYGDIVPMTPCARISVTAEGIFGVFLIGLFLNSLRPKKVPPWKGEP